ncbi:MAG: septal ring lytic transglycosylase RlpA family protein, partial [Acidimicrobiales bacterium]
KGGGLRTQNTGGRRLLVGSLLSVGLLVVPLLLLGTGATLSAAPGVAGGGRTAASASARARSGVIGNLNLAFQLPSGATTTSAPTITTAGAPATTTPAGPRPLAPATTTTRPPADTATGIATWYSEAPPGRCASPWLPKGVTLTITAVATGVTITCLVDDREADNPGRVVDLSPSGFEAMAPLSQGVIRVTISW